MEASITTEWIYEVINLPFKQIVFPLHCIKFIKHVISTEIFVDLTIKEQLGKFG